MISRRNFREDQSGGFLGKSFILILIFFMVFGVALIDGSSILFARLQLGDVADAAASDAAAACRDSHGNAKSAFAAAQATVTSRDATAVLDPATFVCDPKTLNVSLTVTKTAGTVFIKHIGPLEHYAELKATSTQAPPGLQL